MTADHEYVIRFTYGRIATPGTASGGRSDWLCELFDKSPASQADEAMKLAEGRADTMPGALTMCAQNWKDPA